MKQIDVPPIWTVAMLVLVWVLNKIVPIFDFSAHVGRWVPVLLVVVAFVYIGLAFREFGKHKTPFHPRKKPKALITGGIFKVSRNPIYTGFALLILAFAIFQGDIIGLLPLGVFVWVMNKRFIEGEEAVILQNFPEAQDWFQSTRRW